MENVSNNTCEVETKEETCTAPEHATVDAASVTVAWDFENDTWATEPKCSWTCDAHYVPTEDGNGCEVETKEETCTAPEHATVDAASVTVAWDFENDTWATEPKCSWTCDDHYVENADKTGCELEKFTVKFVDEDDKELSSAKYNYGTPAAQVVAPEVKSHT